MDVAAQADEFAANADSKFAKSIQFCVSGAMIFTPELASAGPMLEPTNVASVAPV